MYAIYDIIYHQDTPNVSIYAIHGSYGLWAFSKPPETSVLWWTAKRSRSQVASTAGVWMNLLLPAVILIYSRAPEGRERHLWLMKVAG